jgi:acetyl esterase/lipase
MTVFFALLLLLLAVLLGVHLWLGFGEDLSAHDHPVEPGGGQRFLSSDGPSAGHQDVVAAFRARGGEIATLTVGQMIAYVRDLMDSFADGRTFDAEFRGFEAEGLAGEWVLAPGADPSRRVLYLHGGAFFAGSPLSHRTMTSQFSKRSGAAVLALDYRLKPEHRRGVGIRDCRRAYRWLLEHGPDGPSPLETLFLAGDSAGGNLTLMTAAWARDEGLRKPDVVVAFSPVTDATFQAPSVRQNAEHDTLVKPLFGPFLTLPRFLLRWVYVYLDGYRPVNPAVSPVYGDLSDLPPTLVQASETEMLFDDSRRYVNKARKAGSPVFLQSWQGLLHVWQLFYPEVPEAHAAWEEVSKFIETHAPLDD